MKFVSVSVQDLPILPLVLCPYAWQLDALPVPVLTHENAENVAPSSRPLSNPETLAPASPEMSRVQPSRVSSRASSKYIEIAVDV